MPTPNRPLRFAVCLLFLFAAAWGWALDNALVGKWSMGTGDETALMEIKADGSAVMDGTPITMQAEGGKMKITYRPGIVMDGTYTVSGSTLSVTVLGETEKWTRVGAAPAPEAPAPARPAPPATGNPITGRGNPLATPPAPAAHPAAGVWNDGQLTVALNPAGEGLQGEVRLGDQKYPTTATGTGASIYGTFVTNGDKYMYAAKVNGDTMEFQTDGQTYRLKRQGAPAAPVRQNPLATAPAAQPGPAIAVTAAPDATTGNWLRRPDEGYDILLPGDFRLLKEQGGGLLLGSNVTPGLIIVFPSPAATAADLARAQQQGVQEQTVSMAPSGGVTDAKLEGGAGKVIEVAGTMEQTRVQGLLGAHLRVEGTGGVVILAATTPESWPALKPFAEQAVRGVRFYLPQVSDRVLKARQALAGHSLVTSFNNSTVRQNSSGYHTGTATNSFRAWHCCASGRGRYEGSRSTSFRGGGVIGSSETGPHASDGNWQLQAQGNDFLLTFRFDDGSTASWTVSLDANENVFVDGTRVKVVTDSICNRL